GSWAASSGPARARVSHGPRPTAGREPRGRGGLCGMDESLSQGERDDVALLTGPGASEILQAALAAEGGTLGTWRVHTVHHRPGAGVTVGYTVAAQGHEDYLCATTGRVTAEPGEGLVRLENGSSVVHVWRHP